MKKLLLLGVALLGVFCAVGQTTARAGDDGPVYSSDRSAPRYYEGRVVEQRCYYPPPRPIYYAPPVVGFYGYPRYHRRRFYPYAYGYGGYPYRYAPGVHIGVGF